MIHVVVGNPPQKLLSERSSGLPRSLSGELRARPFPQEVFASATPEDLDWQNLNAEEMLSLARTETLFGGVLAFRFSGALAGERGEEFLKLAKELQVSAHLFLFEEEKLLKGPTTVLEKTGAKIEVHKAPVKKDKGFDPFSVTAALASRDRKRLWLGIVKSSAAGEKPEATAGILVWKVRQMLTSGPSSKYAKAELHKLSRTLVSLYHDSHRGAGDLALLLERFALTL
ncbi:MAG: hypothetical protein WCI89_00530 [bacterium]